MEKRSVLKKNEIEVNKTGAKLNWLRAGVLGANDGIVSISGLVVGVAGATQSIAIILATGIAGVIAGAISMAAGEYVSVSSQRDSEKALLAKESWELENNPAAEEQELVGLYVAKGLSEKTAQQVARELTAHDAYAAHVDAELNMTTDYLTNPWHAAAASAAAFLVGSVIPMAAITLAPAAWRVQATFVAVVFALALTGTMSAKIGGGSVLRAVARVVFGGILAMVVTYAIGYVFGVKGI